MCWGTASDGMPHLDFVQIDFGESFFYGDSAFVNNHFNQSCYFFSTLLCRLIDYSVVAAILSDSKLSLRIVSKYY